MKLPLGKTPPKVLKAQVFRYLGLKRGDVVLGPAKGEDAAIVKAGRSLLALSCDPISGAVRKIGWAAAHIACNDVATRGIRPQWLLSCIMLPPGSGEKTLKEISAQIGSAALRLGVAVVGGHSEVTPGLSHPLVVGFSAGLAERGRYAACRNAKAGAKIILTKGVGIEGTAILASDRKSLLVERLGKKTVERAEKFYREISVVQEALTAFETGGVQAMHDPTEGGLAAGLHELADASGTGFRVYEDKIPIRPETREICRVFAVNPLRLVSSGALLIVAEPQRTDDIVESLTREGSEAAVIGKILKDPKVRVMVGKNGLARRLPAPLQDELWKALQSSPQEL
ncbi:AIR synthase family protein [Candidatus Hecatella orcuttiae]|jgi:hydrogenase maturation factor|uniref:AIR synthase family protein n=1 Tax=Candidatus Hecatella orcuttiae TaxID=1935119 RepID=UPI002867E996|nr:AIR synthase family protein [Candidatus Hecatella orcuttiae]